MTLALALIALIVVARAYVFALAGPRRTARVERPSQRRLNAIRAELVRTAR